MEHLRARQNIKLKKTRGEVILHVAYKRKYVAGIKEDDKLHSRFRSSFRSRIRKTSQHSWCNCSLFFFPWWNGLFKVAQIRSSNTVITSLESRADTSSSGSYSVKFNNNNCCQRLSIKQRWREAFAVFMYGYFALSLCMYKYIREVGERDRRRHNRRHVLCGFNFKSKGREGHVEVTASTQP